MTTLFFLLHEQQARPKDLEFEYMTGALRDALSRREFGAALTDLAHARCAAVGNRTALSDIQRIITEDFPVCVDTAKEIARRWAHDPEIILDQRVCESDLSYLTRDEWASLERVGSADATAYVTHWISHNEKDVPRVVSRHQSLWKEALGAASNTLYVLHVEGMSLFTSWALSAEAFKPPLTVGRGVLVCAKLADSQPGAVEFVSA